MGDIQKLHLVSTLRGRVTSYIFAWAMMVGVYFNPFVAWGQPDPAGKLCAGDYIGIGQWRVEKQRFQGLCVRAMDRIEDRETPRRSSVAGDAPLRRRIFGE